MILEDFKVAIPASIHNLLSGREVEWARIEFKTTWDPDSNGAIDASI